MGFELIAILCVCNFFCLGVSLRTISTQTSTNVLNNLEMKIVQPIDDPTDYDCVDFYKQPAFNHPLLKNHKIQMEPSFQVELEKRSSEGGGCPKGKVPIKRMNNSSILHSDISDQFHQFNREYPGQHFATLDTNTMARYRGATAYINTHDPPVKMGQVSMAQIWLQNGPPHELNNIQAGWAVHPRLYGDNRSYMTAFWTADGHKKTGCYNTLCPGFVQVDTHLYLGVPVGDISIYGGQQYALTLKIIQDKTSGNWWLFSLGSKLGYWPKELFNHLDQGAFVIRFGGHTSNGPDGTSPPMGSGQFASKFNDRSCFIARMSLVGLSYGEIDIPEGSMKINTDTLNCYTLDFWGYQGQDMGETFTFGGPGGICGI